MNRRHLRSQNGIAFLLHFFGIAHLLIRSALCVAIHRYSPATPSVKGGNTARALGGTLARRTRVPQLFQRTVGHAHTDGCNLFNLSRRRSTFKFCSLLFQGSHERTDADTRRAKIGDLINLEHSVNLTGSFQNLLDLVGGQCVKTATKGEELDEVKIVARCHKASRTVQT